MIRSWWLMLVIVWACPAAQPERVLALQGKTAHVQGIDTDGVHLWVTSVDRATRRGFLAMYSVADGRLVRSVEVQDGERYHPGGIATDDVSIWVPVAEYKATSSALIQKRNKRTLALEAQFAVADHIGCIAVHGEHLIGGNWDSREFYVWDKQGKLLRKVAPTAGNAYQDLKVWNGQLVASGLLSANNTAGSRAAVDFLELPSMRLLRRLEPGDTDTGSPLTREGMAVFENRLWLLPEDGASRLFVVPLAPR